MEAGIFMDTPVQEDLLRFLNIVDKRIVELETEVGQLQRSLLSHQAIIQSLQSQKKALKEVAPLPVIPVMDGLDCLDDENWIHLNELTRFRHLPQPSTFRQWMREGWVSDYFYQKVGAKGKIYVHRPRLEKYMKEYRQIPAEEIDSWRNTGKALPQE